MADYSSLRYKDESDRAYGIAGMVISLVVLDGEPYLASVNIDNPIGEAIDFTPAFGFMGNPRLSASLAWRELIKQFEFSTAMLMGNAMCRAYVSSSRPLSNETTSILKDIIRNEGRETYSLEEDETNIIYNRTHRYLERVFTHSGVVEMAHDFAAALLSKRNLSSGEVFEFLNAINR